jgi:hypothetical protein
MSGRIIPLSAVTVSVALAANDAGSAFTLSANPLAAQPISVIFAAGWDGGDITITGTAIANPLDPLTLSTYSEVVNSAPGTTVETRRPFATVTAASKSAVGATTNTVQLKTLYPTKAPLRLGGNVAGGDQIHANLLVLKSAVSTGTVSLYPIVWENGRWWPQPGSPLVNADTDLNKSNVGRFVTIGDPTHDYHVWLAGTGTLAELYVSGKAGPITGL